LETGRTHQIRIHLAESGHFVCGDKVYCQPLFQKTLEDRSGAPRCALHATELGFTHPITGERLRFEMPLPADLQQLLDKLRKAAGSSATGSPTVPADGWPASLERLALAGPAVDDGDSFDDEDGDSDGTEIDDVNGPERAPSRRPASRQSDGRHPDDRRPDGYKFMERPRGENPDADRRRQDRSRDERARDGRAWDGRVRGKRSGDERASDKRPQGERPTGGGRPTGGERPAGGERSTGGGRSTGGRRARRRSKDR
jgi:hypothetical protein